MVESVFRFLPASEVVPHPFRDIRLPIDRDLLDRFRRRFARPDGLSSGSITVQTGRGRGDPIAEPLLRLGEVLMPRQRSGGRLRRVVGGQPAGTATSSLHWRDGSRAPSIEAGNVPGSDGRGRSGI